jgi:hypothetical protein
MKSNQSLHLTIKQPPNPNPVRTLGVFTELDNPALPVIIQSFLSNTKFDSKDHVFHENLRDEVLKLLAEGAEVLTVQRQDNVITINLLAK